MSRNSTISDDDDDVDDMARLVRDLESCIHYNNLARARQLVEYMTREERMTVTCQSVNDYDETLLYIAVESREADFVRFLLEECSADVDEGCDDDTPLLCAAEYPLSEVVQLLIDHGASVNALGRQQLTPVNVASGGADLNLVRYLVEKGADIQLPNIDGQTCLMRSVHRPQPSIEISQYLIEQGASVNAVDHRGDSALHYAVRTTYQPTTTRKCIINMLLRHGADTSICNQFGHDALQTAVLYGSPDSIDYLIEELHPTPDRCADLYSLAAARCVDMFFDFARAVDLWKKSASIPVEMPQDEPTADPNPVYNGAVEARDVESLEAIADDRDALYMQALICRERILGSSHYETIHWLSMRALHYAEYNAFQRGIELYQYASALCSPVSVHPLRGVNPHSQFVRLLRQTQRNGGSVRFDDAAAVLRMMVSMSKCDFNLYGDTAYTKDDILKISVDVLDLLCRLKSSAVEGRSLRQLLGALMQTGCTITRGGNVLHLAVGVNQDGELPSIAVLEELLEAGADVNEVDSFLDTPLHVAVDVYYRCQGLDETENIIELLLCHGAHVDIRNVDGETAADRLPNILDNFDKMQYITLQCLAARTIREHGVEYLNTLPTPLTQFVDLH